MIELLLTGASPLPNNQLIEIVKEPIAIVEQVKELSLEEKIASNYYQCDESVEWIRADTAECLAKRVVTARTTRNVTVGARNKSSGASSDWYAYGYCTWYVAGRRPVGQWNDASAWKSQAKADGWTVSAIPVVGAIAWQSGHVAYVESINGSNVTVSEMNYKGWNIISSRTVPASTFTYIY
jgi:surface antigen